MNLQHHFLIAMPSLEDLFFRRSVVYICEHNEEGSMGLIINKPLENLTVEDILKKMKINTGGRDSTISLDKPIFIGGPLAEDRGFILHSAQRTFSSSIRISDTTVITTSRDVLESLGTASRPEHVLVALGYCAWKKDQLEAELMENAWLTTPADSNVLFQTPIAERWREAARGIGIDIHSITSNAGHA
ncbi:YqgE/AlgH family protein [Pantoea sp. Nvir]|uniref:YqgE/AlgH family protein n=1 Tax=Pantoea sp. Nvir TaxID=2576760 RepID=UPI00135A3A1C|nr:YqgE/AlgH family protein [Pantoea sp. Nvir]MXP66758.1 YqgE/AlgH family protein [Pantoea sp. Nvir]